MPGLRARLLDSPWPITLGLFLPFLVWMGWATGVGYEGKLIHTGVVELWVHGQQPDWAWVPYIHPPGYSGFMNATDALHGWTGVDPNLLILWEGVLCRLALVAFSVAALQRWLGSRPALLGGLLLTLSPQGMRPFEHYPLAALLGTFALAAIVELGRRGGRREAALAVLAVFVAVEVHLSTWFVVGGMMASLFFSMPERRKVVAGASVAMIGAFMLTTYPGLYRVLEIGTGRDEAGGMASGGATLEWLNPVLFVLALGWLIPKAFRHDRVVAALAVGCAVFAVVTTALQLGQAADGQPYPYSLHYYELIDTAVVFAVVFAVQAVRWRGIVVVLAVLSQAGLFFEGLRHVWINRFWLWVTLWPFD